jgi:hypothetical protein
MSTLQEIEGTAMLVVNVRTSSGARRTALSHDAWS